MRKDDYLKSCIELCEKLLSKEYPVEIEGVVIRYWRFFKNHKILMDAFEVGRFWDVVGGVIQDFLEVEDMWSGSTGHELIPILIRDEVPQQVWKAFHIFEDGMRRALEGSRLLYYALSLKLPSGSLKRWMNPVPFYVVNSEAERLHLVVESMVQVEIEEREIAKNKKPVVKQSIERMEQKPSYGNPFESDRYGTLQGELPDGDILPTNKVKIRY